MEAMIGPRACDWLWCTYVLDAELHGDEVPDGRRPVHGAVDLEEVHGRHGPVVAARHGVAQVIGALWPSPSP